MNLKINFPKKRFGQHWLINENVLNEIKIVSELNNNDSVLEIGPGRGALTSKLLDSDIKSLHSVELDKDLIGYLKKKFSGNKKFSLEQGNILNSDIELLNRRHTKVIANIPYNITGLILNMFIGKLGEIKKPNFEKIIFLMQKDVVDRIIAKETDSNRSALSVRIQLVSKVQKICDVSATSFNPIPAVDSSVITFEPLPLEERNDIETEMYIDKLLRIAFNSRRKKLRNTLKNILSERQFEYISNISEISFELRPQDISLSQWITIANCCTKISN
tara:strand:+ start:771 stop:1595 length:825 start_codon:yes stop_codon:yes gene_type:complete